MLAQLQFKSKVLMRFRPLVDSILPFAFNFLSNFCSLHFLKKVDSGTGEFVAAFSVAFIASAVADQATLSRGYKSIRQGANLGKLFLVIYPRIAIILAGLPLAAIVYCFSFAVPFNAVSLGYSGLFVATNATWLYLYGLRRHFYLVSALRLLSACSIYFLRGYHGGLVACAILLVPMLIIRDVAGPFLRFKLRHLKIALLRALLYSGCRLPGLFFLSALAAIDGAFGAKTAYFAANAVYVDGIYKLLSGLAGPLGIIIAKVESLRNVLRASASRVLFGVLFLSVSWIYASTCLSDSAFFVLSCAFLSASFLLSFSYGIPLCRNFSDERWLCVLGFVAVLLALVFSTGARFTAFAMLAGPVSALVFLEASSLLLRTSFRSRV